MDSGVREREGAYMLRRFLLTDNRDICTKTKPKNRARIA